MRIRTACVLAFAFLSAGSVFAQRQAAPIVKLLQIEGQQTQTFAFNPKEISVDKSVPWQKHANSTGDNPTLDFSSGDGRLVSFDVDFDTLATKESVYDKFIAPLEQLTLTDATLKRPPMVKLVWGTLPAFRGVIESLNVKYTLFLPDGTPCRATATVHLREASSATSRDDDPRS